MSALYAFNRPGHGWQRDIAGDVFAVMTDALTLALLVGLALRFGALAA